MEGIHSRRTILSILLLSLILAGCLAGTEVRNFDGNEVKDEEAIERALSAEEEYITRQFENAYCVEEWGLTAYGGIDKDATVSNRTVDGVYVEVTHPYWYSTEQDEVDGGSSALYLVTAKNVQRVNGDDVSPC